MKTLLPEINSADKRFHAGNPATGEQGTRVTDTWLNDVQDRVRDMQAEAHYVLEKAGFTPKQEQQTQLYQAIVKIIDDNRKKASTTQKGEVQLTSDTGLDSEELGLTAKAGKKLAQMIAVVQLALNNYIPLNKRSSSVNSNDENNVATSKAVKTAYDKGVEAKNAADNAQRSANAANDNANGRVSKSGDTMTGSLAITGSQSGGFANGLMLKNKAGGQNTSVFVDFYQTDNIPRASMWMRDAGNNSTQIEFLNTPEGANWYIDSRQNVFTITSSGNLWSRQYGWLHGYFAKQADINNVWSELNNTYRKNRYRSQYYPHHYNGAAVFDVPVADNGVMRIILMNVTVYGYAKVNLPEAFNGSCMVQATDVGGGRKVVGANIQNGNVVEIHAAGEVGLNILAIGWYGW
jgi:probable tail fiber protein